MKDRKARIPERWQVSFSRLVNFDKFVNMVRSEFKIQKYEKRNTQSASTPDRTMDLVISHITILCIGTSDALYH